jgi:hypothetical protein
LFGNITRGTLGTPGREFSMAEFVSLLLFFAIAAAVIAVFGLAWAITRFGWNRFTGRR